MGRIESKVLSALGHRATSNQVGERGPNRESVTPDGRHAVWPGQDGVIRMYRLPVPDRGKTDLPAVLAEPAAAKP